MNLIFGKDIVIVLVGDSQGREMIKRLKTLGWGRMLVERDTRLYGGEPWGFDNGAYGWWMKGEEFDEDVYLERLEWAYAKRRPCLAVTPDKVAAGTESLEFSEKWLKRLPADWPWFLAVQDGMEVADVESVVGHYAGLFLGGTAKFKSTAQTWRELANKHGRLFHYGRCGTIRKLQHARIVGADSLDSAFPLWSIERFEWFAYVFKNGHPQYDLYSQEVI